MNDHVLIKQWIIIIHIVTLLHIIYALNCTGTICHVRPGNDSFAEQVIEVGDDRQFHNSSFTILVYAGDYNATNGDSMNFINYVNVTIKKHPNNLLPVNIMCPGITTNEHFNGIGFVNSINIEISGLNFMRCGTVTSGLFFQNTSNVVISDSTFHHNTDNGIQITFGNYFKMINCSFYSNIGLQPDQLSDLITDDIVRIRGVGLGMFFEDQNDVHVMIEGCEFTNNIAYKPLYYNSSNETRPYSFIPFGNGGGIYLKLNRAKNSVINILNSSFYNNTAIHQGGAVVMIPFNSVNNTLNIVGCTFVSNKVLDFLVTEFGGSFNETNNISAIDSFVNEVNNLFNYSSANPDFIRRQPNLLDRLLRPEGGSGGAIAVSLYGAVEHNVLRVSTSHFRQNVAFVAGAIDFVVRDLLSEVKDGIDSNQAFINNCIFDHNIALSGSAIRVASYSRVDVASLPIEINDCIFKNNDNVRSRVLPAQFVNLFGTSGTVIGIRFPVSFIGTNVFESNLGGGVNINHARVSVQGHMKLYNNHEARYGGAVRLGELTLMHILPNTTLEFINNSASNFGGGLAVNNFISVNDTTVIRINICFIQYNIGGRDEHQLDRWNVTFNFTNNTLTSRNGQGEDLFAKGIKYCVLNRNTNDVFNSSIFSNRLIFNYSQNDNPPKQYFETAPYALILEKTSLKVSLGEIFVLAINAIDEIGNSKDAIYSYHSPTNLPIRPLSTIVVDLKPDEDTLPSFASVSRATPQNGAYTSQNVVLVLHFQEQLKNNCVVNFDNSLNLNRSFTLNLIDSSDGQMINKTMISSTISCCHAAYKYNSTTGQCEFIYDGSNIIFREDKQTKKYIYIRSDRYGGFYKDGNFITATILPSYHHCTQDGKLPGCIVKDDKLTDQCSQSRSGFLCSRCDSGSNEGTALNLIECVSCEEWHILFFIIICFSIVGISFFIIYYNIVLPNALKGFLFFIQVIGYVYRTGVKNGVLQWDFYLSQFFGFSLFFPLCISARLDVVDVVMLGFLTPLIMALCIFIYIILARFIPHLGKRKAVEGIWFLVLIAYVYTADTCLNLMSCTQIHEPVEFRGKRVYYFDGELECFRGSHLPYGVIAVVIAVVVLLSLPIYVLAITFNFIKKGGPLRDVMSSGIKKECHWWSGYDLFRRLLFFIVYLISANFISDYTQLALTTVALLILVITSRVHPYTKKWKNLAEGLILLDLVSISAYFLDYNRLSSAINDTFVTVLLILPFIYFFLYLLSKLLRKRFLGTTLRIRYRASDNFTLTSSSLMRYLKSVFTLSNSEQRNTLLVDNITIYTEFRDELDDFVTVKD